MRPTAASAEVAPPSRYAVVDVTGAVRRALAESGLRRGLVLVSVPHTTCALVLNEDEAGLAGDLARLAAELPGTVEPAGGFAHDRIDDNARAHLFAALAGHSVTVSIEEGALRLGAWQSCLLVEADGPRTRRLEMTFLGE